MVLQVSHVYVSSPIVDLLVLRSSHLASLTLVPIMQSVPTPQTTWVISVTASQGGKVRKLDSVTRVLTTY